MASRDPDDAVVAEFCSHTVKNEAKSAKEGRPIFDDMEACKVRKAGSRDWTMYPATAISHYREEPESGEQVPVTYAERFSRQYRQFKEHDTQTKAGTPLSAAPFLTEARRAELRALNIYTVEALAAVDGQELKNLGTGGRDLKNKAIEYIDASSSNAPNTMMLQELEALKARNAVLEEDAKARGGEGRFKDMTDDQIRDFIKEATGHAPQGALNRKTLVRIALDLQQKAA
jgi:hypothetical protein